MTRFNELHVYLSPANHHKPYANGATEKEQMERLAPLVKNKLEKGYIGVVVHLPTVFHKNQQYTGRPEEAKRRGCKAYVAEHTNACGSSATGGTATGACGFYEPSDPISYNMAKEIVTSLNQICPIKSNRAVQPCVLPWQTMNLGEVREAARYGMTAVLIEHEFHDRLDGANWIVNNIEAIAEAEANAIAKALGLRPRGDVNGDGKVNNLDAAQILKYDAGLTELSEEQKQAADFNTDGKVNNLDASQILKYDAGII